MKIISNETFRELVELRGQRERLAQAHRWLAEFDWLLEPMWGFILKPRTDICWGQIDSVREDMRKAVKRDSPIAEAVKQVRGSDPSIKFTAG